ncbi:hypothetical protein PoB_004673600 [Plakobranchus ocellatus]|uniref:Uncharacterized protein n=1 Tax=Plakobranchus ocellatus TaxID=259542 RepID=A0AAV4BA62_9GAST|nr:hypothetical protein PoB_004673600 [Plakobranchus ocellatus]
MTDHRGTIGIMTFLMASMVSILPLLIKGEGFPSVDFSDIKIRFHGHSLQEFYYCLCEDNIQECSMIYYLVYVTKVFGRSQTAMLSPIHREVTFGCDRPSEGYGTYSCRVLQANDTSFCACAAGCPVSHIDETHSSMCRNKCVNIQWKSCYVKYENFADLNAPLLNSCSPPTSKNLSDSQILAVAIGVSFGFLVILNFSAIIAFLHWRSKKGKTNQARSLESARANHRHGTSDYSVLDAGNNAIGNRPVEHIYNHVSSISGEVGNEAENYIDTGLYSHYSEISDIRTVENENNINLGQHSLYSEPLESSAAENEPTNNNDTGQDSLYSEPVESRLVENETENDINNVQLSLYSEPVESRFVENETENDINNVQLSLYSEPVERRSEVNTTAQTNEYATIA